MNLVRLGHLHTAAHSGTNNTNEGRCETALVCGVQQVGGQGLETVNARVFDDQATDRRELGVPVEDPSDSIQTFHLSGECPWKL